MDQEPESSISNSRRYGAEIRLRVAETNATALQQATNVSEMDSDLVQELLRRCKSDKRNIQMYLNNAFEAAEEVMDNVEEVFAVMDSISVAIEVAEHALEQLPKTPVTPLDEEVSCPTIDVFIENRDIFSMICMLRSSNQEVQTKAALGLLNFVRESESMQNEIRSSGGLPAALVLFGTSTKNLKVVAGMIVALLLTSSSMPSENPLEYVLRVTNCLRSLGNTTTRAISSLNDSSTHAAISRGDTIEAAINGLTILWEFVIDFSVVQDQSTSHSGPLEGLLEKHSEDQVKLELCLVKASVNGWEEKEIETAQKLLAESFDDLESIIDAIEAPVVSNHAEPTSVVAGQRPLDEGTTPTDATCCEQMVMSILIDQRDIPSLLCMLRANQERITIAALALMQFAKEEEDLRNELLSCGGIPALTRLCRQKHLSTEVRVVACMTIAYLVPSFVVAGCFQANPTNCSLMVECLQFLVSGTTEVTVTIRGTAITREMMVQAATNGIYLLWTQVVEPLVVSGSTFPRLSDASSINPATVDSLTVVVDGAQVGDDDDDDETLNQEDILERQQLMEAALNLMDQLDMDPTGTYTRALRHHLDGRRSSFQQSTPAGQ